MLATAPAGVRQTPALCHRPPLINTPLQRGVTQKEGGGKPFQPQICVKGHWEHGKTPVEMDLLSHKYSPATFHPAGEKLPNGHLCNLSRQNLNIGEQETLIHAFLRFKRFPGMTVCGEGELIRTFLQAGQAAMGKELDSSARLCSPPNCTPLLRLARSQS